MVDSRITQIMNKIGEQIIARTDITFVTPVLRVRTTHLIYAEYSFDPGAIKRRTVGNDLYQDVPTMIIVHSQDLETVRKNLEYLLTTYYQNPSDLVALQALKVFDIEPIDMWYPNKPRTEKDLWGYVIFGMTLRFQKTTTV